MIFVQTSDDISTYLALAIQNGEDTLMWFGWQWPAGIEQGHSFALKATKCAEISFEMKPQVRLVIQAIT